MRCIEVFGQVSRFRYAGGLKSAGLDPKRARRLMPRAAAKMRSRWVRQDGEKPLGPSTACAMSGFLLSSEPSRPSGGGTSREARKFAPARRATRARLDEARPPDGAKSLSSRVEVPADKVNVNSPRIAQRPYPSQIDQSVLSPDTGGPLHTGPPFAAASLPFRRFVALCLRRRRKATGPLSTGEELIDLLRVPAYASGGNTDWPGQGPRAYHPVECRLAQTGYQFNLGSPHDS